MSIPRLYVYKQVREFVQGSYELRVSRKLQEWVKKNFSTEVPEW
jgi:hypothetical protein